jgi:hypothetical protein
MTPSSRTANGITITLSRVALGALVIAVILGEIAVVVSAQQMAVEYPEFASLQSPLVTAVIAFGLCVEVVLIVTAVLVGFIRDERIFRPAALKLVDVLVVAILVASVIVGLVLLSVPGPPALALALLGGILAGATFTFVLLVLRSLLRRAVFMRVELDEVV